MEVKAIPKNTLSAIRLMIQPYVHELKEEHIVDAIKQFTPTTTDPPPESKEQPEQFLTVKEVAALLKVTTRSIYNLIKSGQLARVKVNRSTRISVNSYKKYCETVIHNTTSIVADND